MKQNRSFLENWMKIYNFQSKRNKKSVMKSLKKLKIIKKDTKTKVVLEISKKIYNFQQKGTKTEIISGKLKEIL